MSVANVLDRNGCSWNLLRCSRFLETQKLWSPHKSCVVAWASRILFLFTRQDSEVKSSCKFVWLVIVCYQTFHRLIITNQSFGTDLHGTSFHKYHHGKLILQCIKIRLFGYEVFECNRICVDWLFWNRRTNERLESTSQLIHLQITMRKDVQVVSNLSNLNSLEIANRG
jgi:hypothetical protein